MKVALFDIETSPSLGYYFDRWKENNIIEVKEGGYVLSFAVKWLGQKGIKVHALPDYGESGPYHSRSDRALMADMWRVFDAADILIAHNGDKFDIRTIQGRFLLYKFPPPSPFYKSIDTYKIAKRYFKLDSYRLDSVAQYLGAGRKLPTTGKDTWLGCMAGDPKAWATMKRYNAQDVALLERVYIKMRPFCTNHPNLNLVTRTKGCPTCQSPRTVYRGFMYTRTGKRQRQQCLSCGAWSVTGGLIRL